MVKYVSTVHPEQTNKKNEINLELFCENVFDAKLFNLHSGYFISCNNNYKFKTLQRLKINKVITVFN